MQSVSSVVYQTYDPAKKNAEWANICIQTYRRSWRRLVNVDRAASDRSVMFSMQEMNDVRDSFQDEAFKKHTRFYPLPILEVFVNAIVEELCKEPPKAEIRAVDPTAINEKKDDIDLIRNRKILERALTKYNNAVGIEGQYKLDYKSFNGNVEAFDRMGLDESDAEDVNFYEDNYQRLTYETAMQSLLNEIMKINCFDETTLRKIVKDIFAFKAICSQAYVDNLTGEIKYKYIDPQICYGIFGSTNDGKDDICRGWQDSITIWEWLQMVGNEFDFVRDWKQLLWAINYSNTANKFTGFIRDGVSFDCYGNAEWMSEGGLDGAEAPNLLDWSMAYTFKIYCGYIEWRSVDATATYLKSNKNPNFSERVPYSYELKKRKEQKEYVKESYYQQQWYRSYFIATTSISQWIWGFQKVYYQQLSGANDEYSNGTLCYYQEEGKSAVEISKTYLQPANFAFYHMLWLIYKAKPDEDEYLLNEMIALAKGMQRQFPQMAGGGNTPSFDNVLNQVIQYQRKNHVRIRAYPEIEGKTVPQLPGERPKGMGGLDPLTIAMQSVTQWAEAQIAQKIGMNPMRLGANPPSRESSDSEQATIQYSYNTTGYMYRMVQYLKQHIATVTLNYCQDIIHFKESLPYKWIRTLAGDESIEGLKVLDKTCAHRYGIFVGDYNTAVERRRVMQAADMAFQQKAITIDQWAIISQTEDPKKGFAILARLERQRIKREKAFEMQKIQMQDQLSARQHEREMARLNFERETEWGKSDRQAAALIRAADIQASSRVDVKAMTLEGERPKQEAKTQSQKDIIQAKANVEEQMPMDELAGA